MPAIDLFAFLDGASAWWWVALALAIGAVEVVTFTYFLLWPALAAMTVAVVLFIAPGTSGTAQIVIFAVAILGYAIAGGLWLKSRRADGPAAGSGLNRRAAQLVGRSAVVSAPFRGGIGKVEIDGVAWRARLATGGERPEPGAGAILRIAGAEGATLVVSEDR